MCRQVVCRRPTFERHFRLARTLGWVDQTQFAFDFTHLTHRFVSSLKGSHRLFRSRQRSQATSVILGRYAEWEGDSDIQSGIRIEVVPVLTGSKSVITLYVPVRSTPAAGLRLRTLCLLWENYFRPHISFVRNSRIERNMLSTMRLATIVVAGLSSLLCQVGTAYFHSRSYPS